MIYIAYTIMLWTLAWMEEFGNLKTEQKKFFTIFVSLSWLVVSTIRTSLGGDYASYSKYFYNNVFPESLVKTYRMTLHEPLYITLMWLCKHVTTSYAFFNFVTYMIVSILMYLTVSHWCDSEQNSKKHFLSIYFIIWCLQLGNIFVVRQTIGLWICLFSTRYIEQKDFKRFLICVLIAAGFHISSVLFFLSYFIFRYKGSFKKNILIVAIGSGVLFVFFDPVLRLATILLPNRFAVRLDKYIGIDTASRDFSPTALTYTGDVLKGILNVGVILFIIYLIYRYKQHRFTIELRGYINIYFFSCIFYIASLFFLPTLGRLATPFMFMQIPIFVYSYDIFEVKSRVVWWNGFSSYLILRCAVSILSERVAYLPFTTIFSS